MKSVSFAFEHKMNKSNSKLFKHIASKASIMNIFVMINVFRDVFHATAIKVRQFIIIYIQSYSVSSYSYFYSSRSKGHTHSSQFLVKLF